MLNNISTDNVHKKNIWTDSLNNIFYNGCISDEEIKVYCFGAGGGGGGGSGDGGVAGDFGAAEAGLGADPTGSEGALGGKSGTQSDDTGPSDAATDAMSAGALGPDAAFGPALVDPAVPDLDASVFSSQDIDAAFPKSFSIIGSPLSILSSALLSAIPVVGPVLAAANTVLGAVGTFGDVTGISSLANVDNYAPTALASRALASLAPQVGVPSSVTTALTSPIASVEVSPTQTTFGSPFAGGLVDIADPQAQAQVGIDAPIGFSALDDVKSALPSISANIQGSTSFADFDNPEDDNPIAIRATGGLVSLRDDGGPVISKAQEAYMNWLRSQGGPSALSKRGLRRGRIDEVMTPSGPEYFSYSTGESSQDIYGASMYDDSPGDFDMFPFAYPENPNFRELNALGLRRPQSKVPQNTVDVIRQSIIGKRLSDEEEERLRRLRLGLPVVGAYTGGGIQQLVNQEPTLLDVVNKGMSIPEETIPSQRPEQFIKGQQQPGGLRSTNYYTNAMQPASFYAQPQQVRNYGSIY